MADTRIVYTTNTPKDRDPRVLVHRPANQANRDKMWTVAHPAVWFDLPADDDSDTSGNHNMTNQAWIRKIAHSTLPVAGLPASTQASK